MQTLLKILAAKAVLIAGLSTSVLAIAGEPALKQIQGTKTGRLCPMIYRPVTAITRDGRCVRFANQCLADAEGATVVPDGTCGFRSSDAETKDGGLTKPAVEGLPLPWPFPWRSNQRNLLNNSEEGRVRIMPIGRVRIRTGNIEA